MSSVESESIREQGDLIIEGRDLNVTFDMDRGKSRVLDDVDLYVKREEILGIVGESGSGKSMLASSLLDAVVEPGILDGDITFYPDDGNDPINILEMDTEDLKRFRWETISMVFQGAMSSFNPTMKIGEHFRETLEAHAYDMPSGMDRAHELIAELYMDPDRVLDSYPHELSGGMKQRALIALSLVLEPDVLVMDEPTAALDLLMQRSILALIENLQERYNLTIIFITHDLPLVANLADRLSVMYAFKLVEIGPTDEILENSAHPYTRALLKATPNLNVPIDEMMPIAGSSPDPVNVPMGCSYHPRCPLADEKCQEEPPQLEAIADNHEVSCYHWESIDEAIRLEIDRS